MMERASARLGIALKVRFEKKRKSIERYMRRLWFLCRNRRVVLYVMQSS